MNKEKFIELREKIEKLSLLESEKRDLYLKRIANGELQGPSTNYPDINKAWMQYYTDEQIMMQEMPKMRMIDYMKKSNLDYLDDVAIKYFGTTLTFGEFFNKIDECAKSLKANGIGKGDKVTICMPSTPEAVISVYAINKIGAVANMVHPLSSENQIKEFVNRVNSKLVITIDQTYNKVNNIKDETSLSKIVVVSPSDSMPPHLKMLYPLSKDATKIKDKTNMTKWKDFIKEGKSISEVPNEPYEENRTAVILQTGGTTGIPKGVELTDDNFNAMVQQLRIDVSYERGDKMLTVMPPFHGFGLCSSIHLPLSYGVGIVLIPRVNIQEIDKLMTKNKITHLVAVPTLFKGMMKVVREKENKGKLKNFDLSGLKYAVSGGSLAKNGFEKDVDSFLEKHGCKVKLKKGYGLSEAVAGVTFASDDMKNENTVGVPMIASQVKIVDPETKEELETGEIGEICVKSDSVMKGYFNNPEANKRTLINGWLHTGDLGYFAEDGQLYFSERKGNMIISSGVNVYPCQIEEVIETHYAVSGCAVIGIHHPYKEEVPKAYVVLKEGYEANEEINEEISELCKKKLDRYSWPDSFEYINELPQTLLGKISHKQLKEQEGAKVKQIKPIGSKIMKLNK